MSNARSRAGLARRAPLAQLLLLLSAAILTVGCQPEDEAPGTWLRGDQNDERVADWQFTDAIDEIFIETRPWYVVPHSTTIWCVSLDGKLFVGSYGDEKKAWERNIARRPEARLLIDGRLYDVTLDLVSDRKLMEKLDAAYGTKYDMEDVFGDEVPAWWYYAVAQRDG